MVSGVVRGQQSKQGCAREDQALPLRGSLPLVPRAASPLGCSLLPLHQHVVLSVVKYGGRVQPRILFTIIWP